MWLHDLPTTAQQTQDKAPWARDKETKAFRREVASSRPPRWKTPEPGLIPTSVGLQGPEPGRKVISQMLGADAVYQSELGGCGKILRWREALSQMRPAGKRASDGKIVNRN